MTGTPIDRGARRVASIYAEFAHDRGWLRPDRTLTAEEFLRRELIAWPAHDHTLAEAREKFGRPSVLLGGTNPFYGKTLAHLTGPATEPIIFFHLNCGAETRFFRTGIYRPGVWLLQVTGTLPKPGVCEPVHGFLGVQSLSGTSPGDLWAVGTRHSRQAVTDDELSQSAASVRRQCVLQVGRRLYGRHLDRREGGGRTCG